MAVLSFDVTNGMVGQDSPAVSIEVTPQPSIALTHMFKAEKNAAPMLIGKHVYAPKIGQSTSSGSDWKLGRADRVNTITVTFSTNMWLTSTPKGGGMQGTAWSSPNCTFTMRGLLVYIEGSGTLTEYVTHGYTATTSRTQVTLESRASSVDNEYVGHLVRVRNDYEFVSAYVGSSKVGVGALPQHGWLDAPYSASRVSLMAAHARAHHARTHTHTIYAPHTHAGCYHRPSRLRFRSHQIRGSLCHL